MKIVYRAENIIDAHLVRNALAQEGIVAFVSGEYLTGALGELPALDLVAIMVAEHDVERAVFIARSVDAALREERGRHADPAGAPLPAF
ncbi:MAG: DUF2007 domain-containing protein [Rhodanobacter sp.]|nr:DUF2007 domain-containing protein [Rhodanobacter sp.]